MTDPHEKREKAFDREQRFDGTVEETEYPSPIDTDKRIVRQLEVRLGKGDRIIIPAVQSPNPALPTIDLYVEGHDMTQSKWEAPVKATVAIGGDTGGKVYKPDTLNFISLKDAPYSFLPAYLVQYGTTPEEVDWLVVAEEVENERRQVTGQSFIGASGPDGIIGRAGNMTWIKFGAPTEQERWNPFLDNPSIAENHLMLSVVEDDLAITGQSDAPTVLNTRASQEHLTLLGT